MGDCGEKTSHRTAKPSLSELVSLVIKVCRISLCQGLRTSK